MPRVLLLCEYPTLNGGEQSLLAVLPHLIAAGYAFDALAPAEGPLAEAWPIWALTFCRSTRERSPATALRRPNCAARSRRRSRASGQT